MGNYRNNRQILAILNFSALFPIGVEYANFFGIFAANLNIVFFFGPFVGSIPPILFIFLTHESLYYPVAVAGAFIIIQWIETYLLTPRIVGSNVRINPLVVFTGPFGEAMKSAATKGNLPRNFLPPNRRTHLSAMAQARRR